LIAVSDNLSIQCWGKSDSPHVTLAPNLSLTQIMTFLSQYWFC